MGIGVLVEISNGYFEFGDKCCRMRKSCDALSGRLKIHIPEMFGTDNVVDPSARLFGEKS